MFSLLFKLLEGQFLFFALHFENTPNYPPPLSSSEERNCFEKMSQGDENARNKLIEHNLRLVSHIIKKYYSNSAEQEDLISIGTIGLIKAVSTFDYTKGTRFATYAGRCVENEILMYFRSAKKMQGEMHLEDIIESDKDGSSLSLLDVTADSENISDTIERSLIMQEITADMKAFLTEREQEIIALRYGLIGGREYTQKEVAAKLGISRSYVSRIEKRAIGILREKMTK